MLARHCLQLFQPSFKSRFLSKRAMEEAGRALVDSGIKNNKTFVISKSYCPFCIKAKTILKYAAGHDPVVVEINGMPECDEIQNYCLELTGSRSVPQVWVNQKLIGGSNDVELAYKNGKL